MTTKHIPVGIAVALVLMSSAAISQQDFERSKAIGGRYEISERETAHPLQLRFTGESAADLFHGMGNWTKVSSCGPAIAETRDRGDLRCWVEDRRYTCVIGFDLTTGESRYAAIC